ncbi:unnamed protein product [Didymodactylos carnosus]|uniref:RZ-type domain-containing protein n=1 Tax=Didymodactylos carnosus TaxID=1234261 RepID=A0A8S2IZY0_9BILA|nr:unnamed protein product [Didymodactylos carnosus]CAF3771790.1 unnamed protein product [Didymodactylos carnosus]
MSEKDFDHVGMFPHSTIDSVAQSRRQDQLQNTKRKSPTFETVDEAKRFCMDHGGRQQVLPTGKTWREGEAYGRYELERGHKPDFHQPTDHHSSCEANPQPSEDYRNLCELADKDLHLLISEILKVRFKVYLNDKRMGTDYKWIKIMTTILENVTLTGDCEGISQILIMIPGTIYMNGVHEEIRKPDINTNQLKYDFIQSFLRIADYLLTIMPHSESELSKILERIEIIIAKTNENNEHVKDIKESLQRARTKAETIFKFEQHQVKPQKTTNSNYCDTAHPPPNNYRHLSIMPTMTELLDNQVVYLRRNITKGVYVSPDHYLDIHFRLLREDFVGPLRDGIQCYRSGVQTNNLNVRIHHNVRNLGPKTINSGLVFQLKLDDRTAKRIHWQNSRRLIYGSLLALTQDNFQSFMLVRAHSPDHVIVLNRLPSTVSLTMLETTAYFESYRPVLEALQKIRYEQFPLIPYILSLTKDVSPPDYITVETKYNFTPLLVKPSSRVTTYTRPSLKIMYCGHEGVLDKHKSVTLLDESQWPTSDEMKLNPSQVKALRLALTKKVAVIQGPPGTGKTHLGVKIAEMLLYNHAVRDQTPILILSYTNHALDQFLEQIKNRLSLTTGLIRVGGRSKTESMNPFLLSTARTHVKYLLFKRAILEKKRDVENTIKETEEQIKNSYHTVVDLSTLKDAKVIDQFHLDSLLYDRYDEYFSLLDWLGIEHRLHRINDCRNEEETKLVHENVHTDEYGELVDENEEETEENRRRFADSEFDNELRSEMRNRVLQRQRPQYEFYADDNQQHEGSDQQRKSFIRRILNLPTKLNENTVKQICNLWNLSFEQRHDLYRYWLEKYRRRCKVTLERAQGSYDEYVGDYRKYLTVEDYEIMRNATVIGMTTTCAAKYFTVLQKIGCKIIIVEEAAEIFEAHIICSLSAKCEHLILIGDHQQLRPNPTVYRLAQTYNIDVSLFERFIKNDFPSVRLNIQYRMRPEICDLMRSFYPDLQNHDIVKTERPSIIGIKENLYFITHAHEEETLTDASSKRNPFEAEYIVELASYLIKQGYETSQLTILVMYLAQCQLIAKLMKEHKYTRLKGIRVMNVDNYQGEENDIILLSLVRNNLTNNLGFLKIQNRVCVALSRAKCGLYILGNFDMLRMTSDMWYKIAQTFIDQNAVGRGLNLYCIRHTDAPSFLAHSPKSFSERPEGKLCDTRLPCGHKCYLVCHNYDLEHEKIKCRKTCDESLVNSIQHCKQFVSVHLPCGHSENVLCHVEKTKSYDSVVCKVPCRQVLLCGHTCKGTCSTCQYGQLHVECQEKCEKQLICGHRPQNKTVTEKETVNPRFFEVTRSIGGIGLCGEPCPSWCRICDRQKVKEIFFGNEDEPDARFVQLSDCRHIIEVDGLDRYINDFVTKQEEKVIRLPDCPKCKTLVRRSVRYKHVVNEVQSWIEKVKTMQQNQDSVSRRQKQLFELIQRFLKVKSVNDTEPLQKLSSLKRVKLNMSALDYVENTLTFLKEMHYLRLDAGKEIRLNSANYRQMNTFIDRIVNYMFKKRHIYTQQQLHDIKYELMRIKRFTFLYDDDFLIKETSVQISHNTIREKNSDLRKLVLKCSPFTNQDCQQFDALYNEIKTMLNLPGLGITNDERIQIVNALNLKQGHWFICQNGHPYVIGECGGATQRSHCPECNAEIGGENHQLISTNQHFGLMDNSTTAAYSNNAHFNAADWLN